MKRFYSTYKTFQYHLHLNPHRPPPKKNESIRLSRNYKNMQNMKPVHIAQVSYFAQVLYFALYFETTCKCFQQRPFGVNLLQSINKFQQAEKKINNERRKEKIYGCLIEEHVEYTTCILSARHQYFV